MNIKFVIEGMEEAGSLALEELVKKEKAGFFSNVDYIVISDNLWISQSKPALTYGTRGNSYFMVEVLAKGSSQEEGCLLGSWWGWESRCTPGTRGVHEAPQRGCTCFVHSSREKIQGILLLTN